MPYKISKLRLMSNNCYKNKVFAILLPKVTGQQKLHKIVLMEMFNFDISRIFGKKSYKHFLIQQNKRKAFSGAVFKDLQKFHSVT